MSSMLCSKNNYISCGKLISLFLSKIILLDRFELVNNNIDKINIMGVKKMIIFFNFIFNKTKQININNIIKNNEVLSPESKITIDIAKVKEKNENFQTYFFSLTK